MMDISTILQEALNAQNAGSLIEAARGYRRVLELDPNNSDALHLLGIVCQLTGNSSEAERLMRRAIELRPDGVTFGNLGLLLHELGRLGEAEECYQRSIQLKPDFHQAHFNLGNLLHSKKRFSEAEQCYRKVLAIQPDSADVWFNLASLLQTQSRTTEAETAYRRVLSLQPASADAENNLGNVLKSMGRLGEAEAAYRRVLALHPDFVDAWSNLGQLLTEFDRTAEAETAWRRVQAVDPSHAVSAYNLGKLLRDSSRFDEAELYYRRALAARPDLVDARYNLSGLLLALGRYAEAWPLFESRLELTRDEGQIAAPRLPFPRWQGEPLNGKSLLLWPEQGIGDRIQFVRFCELLKSRGLSRLTLMCADELVALFQSVNAIDAVVTMRDPLDSHDYWEFPLSLPLRLGITLSNLPADMPYLHAPSGSLSAWKERLPITGTKVGLVWHGNPDHPRDRFRSLPGLDVLRPLWSVPGITFISLQRGAGEVEAELATSSSSMPLIALGKQLSDFADTAAVVSQLDLVISVDTAVAHLAGALGKPCWTLLDARNPDWRWLIGRDDSPWYPGMRLFRQSILGDWGAVIQEISGELDRLVSGGAAGG